jgi:gamma-glutamyltranspeptidase/glutathione hydrolase
MRQTLALLLIAACLPMWAAQPVRARHGMVVSRERHATETGLRVLKNGGNAIDAAAAVGLALAVTHPSAGNIGGGGFMLIRLADGRTVYRLPGTRSLAASRNMYLEASGKATQDSVTGYRASRAGHRGLFASKSTAKPWAELVSAVELAAKGFLCRTLAQSAGARGLTSSRNPAHFSEGRKFYEAGELLRSRNCAPWSGHIPRIFTKARRPAFWPKTWLHTAA